MSGRRAKALRRRLRAEVKALPLMSRPWDDAPTARQWRQYKRVYVRFGRSWPKDAAPSAEARD